MADISAFPNIDSRIKAVGVSKLRDMNSTFLRGLGEDVYIIQDSDEPVAVLISYHSAVEIVKNFHTKENR